MKIIKSNLIIKLITFLICSLICSSSLNLGNTNALSQVNSNHITIDSYDHYLWEWSTREVISTESVGYDGWSYCPSIATDNLGNVHVAWHDQSEYLGAGDDWDIFYKCWNSSTFSWTTTEIVSTESTLDSEYVSIAVDIYGNVHFTWFDESMYAGSGIDQDIFYKQKEASTASWTTTEVVSTVSTGQSSDPKIWEEFLKVDNRDFFDEHNPMGQRVGKCMELADFKIFNDGHLDKSMKQIEKIWGEIKEKC